MARHRRRRPRRRVTGCALSLQLADRDFDKQIEIVATTDGWDTVIQPDGARLATSNRWYWAEDYP
ncbi:MAG: hypothetical protein HS111_30965 [Kofleriaceae bacterium]|nr:hypothetical protein [Kofleriaceae bacterium]